MNRKPILPVITLFLVAVMALSSCSLLHNKTVGAPEQPAQALRTITVPGTGKVTLQ